MIDLFKQEGACGINDVFSDSIVLKAYDSFTRTKPRGHTNEYYKAKERGFVFSKWVNLNENTMLMVKPAQRVVHEHKKLIGYGIDNIQLCKCVNLPAYNVIVGSDGFISTASLVGRLTEENYKLLLTGEAHKIKAI